MYLSRREKIIDSVIDILGKLPAIFLLLFLLLGVISFCFYFFLSLLLLLVAPITSPT